MTRQGLSAAGILVALALAACSKQDGARIYSIDGQSFEVPKEYVLPAQVEWFPARKQAGTLVFSSDPAAPLTDQFSVTLESRKITCRPDKIAATSMLTAACAKGMGPLPAVDIDSLRREPLFPGNKALWVYTAVSADGSRAAVASCYAAAASKFGDTCSAFGRYGSLVYSLSLRDQDIAHLNDRRARIESLLAAWEKR
jgi:hypothetical protein